MSEKEKKVSRFPGETPEEEPKTTDLVNIIPNSRLEAVLIYAKLRQDNTPKDRAIMESLL